jgi:ArsR family transcriptional regulator
MYTTALSDEITRLHAELCSALGDASRILILYTLAAQPRTVKDIAAEAGLSQPAASRHLKVLRERGLVGATRRGLSVEYRLLDGQIIQALDLLRGALRASIARRAELLAEPAPEPPAELPAELPAPAPSVVSDEVPA